MAERPAEGVVLTPEGIAAAKQRLRPRPRPGRGRKYKRQLRAELRQVEKRLDNAVAVLRRIVEAKTDDPEKLRKLAAAGLSYEANNQEVHDA